MRELLADSFEPSHSAFGMGGHGSRTPEQVEEAVEYLERIAALLQALQSSLTKDMKTCHEQQVKGVEPLLDLLETKNALLIELLKRIRVDEADCRQNMDLLSQQADRAKKTVATATALALHITKQDKQKDNLGQIRGLRDNAAEKLKAIVQQRSLAQNQILNISTITAEMRADVRKRNYKLMLTSLGSSFFAHSLGLDRQTELVAKCRALAQLRVHGRDCLNKIDTVKIAHSLVRKRIATLVVSCWK